MKLRGTGWPLALAAAVLSVALVLASACWGPEPGGAPAACDCVATEVNDPAVKAFLLRAKAAHAAADEAASPEQAIAALEALTAPAGEEGAEREVVAVVLADTLARLADLRSGRGQFERARADVERGFELVPEPNYYRGRLLEVGGLVEERRAAAAADAAAASAARQLAARSYGDAMQVQDVVIVASERCPCPAGVVDPSLLAFLSKARAAHHHADLDREPEQSSARIEVLQRVVEGPLPGASDPAPEVREVLADTHARLADLRSERGDFAVAHAELDRGLSRATGETHFRGRLEEVRGLVEQRFAAERQEAGDLAAAGAARERAIAAFQRAVAIQERVIQDALGGLPPAESPGPPATSAPPASPPAVEPPVDPVAP